MPTIPVRDAIVDALIAELGLDLQAARGAADIALREVADYQARELASQAKPVAVASPAPEKPAPGAIKTPGYGKPGYAGSKLPPDERPPKK